MAATTRIGEAIKPATSWLGLGAFWTTVVKVELTDIVFAIDSILVAVAMSPKLWVIITGGLLGIVAMRLLIGQLLSVVQRFPALVDGAFVIIAWVGIKLLVEYLHQLGYVGFEIPKWLSLGLIVVIFGGFYAYARYQGPVDVDSSDEAAELLKEHVRVIDILYEHPAWFARLFEGLEARGVPYRRVHAAALRFVPDWKHDPAARAAAPDLLINRMSPSADRRGSWARHPAHPAVPRVGRERRRARDQRRQGVRPGDLQGAADGAAGRPRVAVPENAGDQQRQ